MTLPQHKNPSPEHQALAPYNFVPLPEKVLRATPVDLDAYHAGRHTGWFDCVLTTETPLYVRCGLLPEQDEQDKNRPDFFFTDPTTREPVIPGSSLRGMLRALVEIISYSKVQPVSDVLKVTFRAVAAPVNDPLSQPYKDAMGKFGANVKVGYLERRGEQWWVCPAQRPQDLGLPEKGGYLKVKDRSIPNGALPHLVRFNQPGYQPQYHEVSFNTGTGRGKQGAYVQITYIGPRGGQGKYKGVLICSGNMAETSAGSSKRKNYVLVLEANPKAKTIIIPAQVVKDYVDSLTEFQKEAPFDERGGCLVAGRPVFYLEANGEVIAFGHTPNFRLPAWLSGSKPRRAATPLDFVPAALRNREHTDLAEALFGYVEDTKEVQREVARAGRVCVTDAQLQPGQGNVWVSAQPITPKILGSPKPTTFQHYLVQTEPNDKKSLRHYASPTPAETVIRGHKLYWHKPNLQRSDWEESPTKIKSGAEDRQHTNIKPVRAGVQFASASILKTWTTASWARWCGCSR